MKRLKPALAAALVVTLSACALAAPSWFKKAARTSSALIKSISKEQMPAGFGEPTLYPSCGYGIDCMDPNARLMAAGSASRTSLQVCMDVIAFAKTHGADSYMRDPEYVAHKFSDTTVMGALPQCAMLLNPTTLGTAPSTRFSLLGTDPRTQAPVSFNLGFGDGAYNLEVTTAFQDPESPPDAHAPLPEMESLRTLLALITAARTSPQASLTKAQVAAALAGFTGPTVTPVVGSGGRVDKVNVAANGMMSALCLYVGPWNEQATGVPDPGAPYDLINSEVQPVSFGQGFSGACS